MRYLCDPHVIPTNTCPPDFIELGLRTEAFTGFASVVQLDVADGKFAPVVSWPYGDGQFAEFETLPATQKLPFSDTVYYEVHMMVQDPARIGEVLARMGAKRLLPHVESLTDTEAARAAFVQWRAAGAEEIGLSLLIDTPLESIEPFINDIEVVQIMSIAQVGAQGQAFDDRALQRVEELHARYPNLVVSVDGGVSEANIESLVRAGANRLCVGSAISKSEDPAKSFTALGARAMQGCAPLEIAA